jgi:hypothetical protein
VVKVKFFVTPAGNKEINLGWWLVTYVEKMKVSEQ